MDGVPPDTLTGARLTGAAIAERLRDFGAAVSRSRGDGDLAGQRLGWTGTGVRPRLRTAAVLIGLIERPVGWSVLLTRRTDHLQAHAGQVAFPGGRCEPDDRDAAATALREAREEVGLTQDRVRLIGALDTYITVTGFSVTPVVGFVDAGAPLIADPQEVAEIFELPLSVVLSETMPQTHSRRVGDIDRPYYAFPYHRHYVWGATAGMLVNLREALGMPVDPRAPVGK